MMAAAHSPETAGLGNVARVWLTALACNTAAILGKHLLHALSALHIIICAASRDPGHHIL
jgi:hypothetical protein